MNYKYPIGIFVILLCIFGLAYSKDPFNQCNRYTSFGYGYRDFFEYVKSNFSANQVFYLEFYVRTSSDAHILLKSTVGSDYAFEIVIGGGSNTFSQIRLIQGEAKNTMITQKTENFLSDIEYRPFWISIDQLGILSVGKKEDEVFLNWRFDNPYPVKYFSFGSWTNVKADWRFGCKNQTNSEIVEEQETLSPLQKLKHDLFTLYDPNALPVDGSKTMEVKINFWINKVQLNEKRGELTIYGYGDLKWLDGKMRWKPENYNGIQTIYIPPFQIWTPSIRVLNALAIDKLPLFDLTTAGVIAKFDGSIFWRPPFKSVSSCVVDLKFWPTDAHNCSVYFGFWMEPPNLVLTVMDEHETMHENKPGSEWEVMEVIPFNSDHDQVENYGILYVELKRAQETQVLLFTVPYMAAVVMSLSSFWVSPFSSFKLYLSCGSLIILLLILFLMGVSVPVMPKSVPRIVQLYSWTAVVFCTPIALSIILKCLHTSIYAPKSMLKILNHELIGIIFCLPSLSESEYVNLNEDENKARRYRLSTLRMVTIIERIFFLGHAIVLVLLNILT